MQAPSIDRSYDHPMATGLTLSPRQGEHLERPDRFVVHTDAYVERRADEITQTFVDYLHLVDHVQGAAHGVIHAVPQGLRSTEGDELRSFWRWPVPAQCPWRRRSASV